MYKTYARSEGKKHNLSFESWGIIARYLYFIIHGAIKVAIRQVRILEAYTQRLCFQEKGCVYWLGFRLCVFYSYYFPLRMIKKPKSWSDGSVPVRSKALFSARNKTPKLKKKSRQYIHRVKRQLQCPTNMKDLQRKGIRCYACSCPGRPHRSHQGQAGARTCV